MGLWSRVQDGDQNFSQHAELAAGEGDGQGKFKK